MALNTTLHGIIVTGRGDARSVASPCGAAGETVAVSSRFFAPEAGVFEDPVTGSAHVALAPYWAPILGTERFLAYQASERGGLIRITLRDDRVLLAGKSVVVAEGRIADGLDEGLAYA
jgi:predicted PhzF superfamily epimerase YddE/YHI9